MNGSIVGEFVATVLKLVSLKKNFSQSTLRRKDIKEYEVYQKTDYSVFRKRDILKLFAS